MGALLAFAEHRFEVRDVRPRRQRRRYQFVDRRLDLVVILRPHVAHADAAIARDDLAEIAEFGRFGIDAGHIFEAIGNTEGAQLQFAVELRCHASEPGRVKMMHRIRHPGRAPQRAVSGEQGDVDVDRRAVDGVHPAFRVEIPADPRAFPILAERHRGHAHRQESCVGIVQRVAMAVHVDEARGEQAAFARDDARGRSAALAGRRGDPGDPIARNEDIGEPQRRTRPIDQHYLAEQRRPFRRRARAKRQTRQRSRRRDAADELPPCQGLGHDFLRVALQLSPGASTVWLTACASTAALLNHKGWVLAVSQSSYQSR